MTTPKTWDLLGAFEACLAQIRTANGYYSDAGAFVTREPTQIPDDQGALIAIALDGLSQATDGAVRSTHRLATVLVVGKVATGRHDAQLRLHELLADIEQCFAGRQSAFPAGMQFPVFVDAKPVPPTEGMAWIGVQSRYSTHVPKR